MHGVMLSLYFSILVGVWLAEFPMTWACFGSAWLQFRFVLQLK
jgi:hypothetical protein